MTTSSSPGTPRREMLRIFTAALSWGLARVLGDETRELSPLESAERAFAAIRQGGITAYYDRLDGDSLAEFCRVVRGLSERLPLVARQEFANRLDFNTTEELAAAAPEELIRRLIKFMHDWQQTNDAGDVVFLAAQPGLRVKHLGTLIVGDKAYLPYFWVDEEGEGAEFRIHPRLTVLSRSHQGWLLEFRTGQFEFAELIHEHRFQMMPLDTKFLGIVRHQEDYYVIQHTTCRFPNETVHWTSCVNPRVDDELLNVVQTEDAVKIQKVLVRLNRESMARSLDLMAAYAKLAADRAELERQSSE